MAAASPSPALPLDAEGILALAARSMFQLFSSISQGMFLIDRTGRIVWVNEGYRRFLPDLMDLVLDWSINPGKVFDLELPLADVAEGYRAMDERRAIKTLLRV